MREFILKKKRVLLLNKVEKNTPIRSVVSLTKNVYKNHSSSLINLKLFEEIGLVNTKMEGRNRNVCITEKGKEVLNNLNKIVPIMNKLK